MDPVTLSALISGGSSIIGGLLGQNQAERNRATQLQIAQQNMQLQKEFAEHGVTWRAADARSAEAAYGINALVGMGVQPASFSPVSVGDLGGGNELGKGIADAGQNIARAVQAYKSPEERAVEAANTRLELEHKQLSNDVLRAEIGSKLATTTQAGSPPPVVKQDSLIPVAELAAPKMKPEEGTKSFRMFNRNWYNDPWSSDAQTIEDIFGEGASDWLYPLYKIPAVAGYNYYRHLSNYRRSGGPAATQQKFNRYMDYIFNR